MIEIKITDNDKAFISDRVVNELKKDIIGEPPHFGVHGVSRYDVFQNQVANLVAEKIFRNCIESEVISKRIDTIMDKIEKGLNDRANKEFERPKEVIK